MFKFFNAYIIGPFLLFELILQKLFLTCLSYLKLFLQGFPLNLICLLLLQKLKFYVVLCRLYNHTIIFVPLCLLGLLEFLSRLFVLLLLMFQFYLLFHFFALLKRDEFSLSRHDWLFKFGLPHFLFLILQLFQLHRAYGLFFVLSPQTQQLFCLPTCGQTVNKYICRL